MVYNIYNNISSDIESINLLLFPIIFNNFCCTCWININNVLLYWQFNPLYKLLHIHLLSIQVPLQYIQNPEL
jgi:hypothetical protein